jgi:hypothetical protein
MPLPPTNVYSTKDEMWESIQSWAEQHKYCFRIGRSQKINKKDRIRITYECDRAGKPPIQDRPQNDSRRPQKRIRSTSTTKTGCLFSVIGVQFDDHWELRHRPDPKYSTHNHGPSLSAFAHPTHRRLSKGLIRKAEELFETGKNL